MAWWGLVQSDWVGGSAPGAINEVVTLQKVLRPKGAAGLVVPTEQKITSDRMVVLASIFLKFQFTCGSPCNKWADSDALLVLGVWILGDVFAPGLVKI